MRVFNLFSMGNICRRRAIGDTNVQSCHNAIPLKSMISLAERSVPFSTIHDPRLGPDFQLRDRLFSNGPLSDKESLINANVDERLMGLESLLSSKGYKTMTDSEGEGLDNPTRSGLTDIFLSSNIKYANLSNSTVLVGRGEFRKYVDGRFKTLMMIVVKKEWVVDVNYRLLQGIDLNPDSLSCLVDSRLYAEEYPSNFVNSAYSLSIKPMLQRESIGITRVDDINSLFHFKAHCPSFLTGQERQDWTDSIVELYMDEVNPPPVIHSMYSDISGIIESVNPFTQQVGRVARRQVPSPPQRIETPW